MSPVEIDPLHVHLTTLLVSASILAGVALRALTGALTRALSSRPHARVGKEGG